MVRVGNEHRERPQHNGESIDTFRRQLDQAVSNFGSRIGPKLRAKVGQSEANITSAVEGLLSEVAGLLGVQLLVHSEASERLLGIRPDLAVDVAGARVGVVELKAPGMGVPGDARWGKARDRAQWERFKVLPNVMYTDGSTWCVYHYGQPVGDPVILEGDVTRAGSKLRPRDSGFGSMLSTFLLWEPVSPRDLRSLIKISAGLCSFLRDEVSESLRKERGGESRPLFTEHLADWQEWLFPDLTDGEFVDSYAQTITFGLLLARREGVIFEGLEMPDIGERLAKRHLLVGRALSILTARPDRGLSVEERSIALQTMRRVIGVADWTQWRSAGTYHWLYEEFLQAYDPVLRKQTGAYYTPTAVTDFMTQFVDEVLRTDVGVGRGLADKNVVVLDPAMGTGTFLQSVVDCVAKTVASEGGDVPASLRELLSRMIGFERQIGPYAVAELKLDQALDAHSAEAKDEDFRLYVADTLDDPNKMPLPVRGRLYAPLADSRKAANKVKIDEPVMVALGNPPYRAKAKSLGKWILQSDGRRGSLLDDFRAPNNGRREYKLHDLAIYFWRWALWKTFESTPWSPSGVVAFITTNAYLNGPAFAGMRRYLRQQADYGWIVDLSPEGHWSSVNSRVFPGVPHPVCIGVFARRSVANLAAPARIKYLAFAGTQEQKFDELGDIHIDTIGWQDCSNEWFAPLRPIQAGSWSRHPLLEDILPANSLGFTTNRAWVHSPSEAILRERWKRLISASPREKRRLLKETGDRTIDKVLPHADSKRRITLRAETSREVAIAPIGFRSFDRQYLIADQRVIDRPRPTLWGVHSDMQIYLITHLQHPITTGPAVVFSARVPDVDYFKSNHGGRVFPLYCDSTGDTINAAPHLLSFVEDRLHVRVQPEELMSYVAGVMAHTGYVEHFRNELGQPGPRLPLTAEPTLWAEAVKIGREIIWLHTYFDGFGNVIPSEAKDRHLARRPRVIAPVPGTVEGMPDSIEHCPDSQILHLGDGQVGPVSEAAWTYEVSGMRVIKHWFDYRKRSPAGRRGGSDLDMVVSDRWTLAMTEELRSLVTVLEGCVALEPRQGDVLKRILSGPLITTTDLTAAAVLPPPSAARRLTIANQERLF